MKTSVVTDEFRRRYLEHPDHPGMFEGRAIVFEGPEDYHHRIDDPSLDIDEDCFLFIRNCGPVGYPGAAEVVNMRPPTKLIEKGVKALPTIGDGRQSGTSESPSILNASPEAAIGGNLAILRTGDTVRLDLPNRRLDVLIEHEEIAQRQAEVKRHPPKIPPSQTPWQEIYRSMVGQLSTGACLEPAVLHLKIVETYGTPATQPLSPFAARRRRAWPWPAGRGRRAAEDRGRAVAAAERGRGRQRQCRRPRRCGGAAFREALTLADQLPRATRAGRPAPTIWASCCYAQGRTREALPYYADALSCATRRSARPIP